MTPLDCAQAVVEGCLKKHQAEPRSGYVEGFACAPCLAAYAEQVRLEQWKKHICYVHNLPSGAPQPTCACLLCIETAVRAERARCIQTVRDAVVQELPGADTILERIVDALRAEAGETRAECPYCYCYESLTSGCDCGCHK